MKITRSSCNGKARYHTIKMAEHNQKIRERATDIPLHIYHCPLCDGWHLTKAEQEENVDGTTCNRCGTPGLVLMHTGMRWKLFEEKGHEHHCRALDSDFEDLT